MPPYGEGYTPDQPEQRPTFEQVPTLLQAPVAQAPA